MKMLKTMKNVIIIGVAATVVVVSLATPAMADKKDHQGNDPPSETTVIVDPIRDPLKDPGIRSCDLTPPGCENTNDKEDSASHDSANPPFVCIQAPCGSSPGEEEDRVKDPGIRLCDITPTECQQDTEGSPEDHGYNSGVKMGTDDPNNPVQEEPLKEKNSTQQKPSAQQAATAPDVYGCPYDYDYAEEFDTCVPGDGDFPFSDVVFGDKPFPDSAGGYVGLAGGFGQEILQTVGVGVLQIGLGHYVGDTLVDFGEGGGPIGWGIQGLGYTLGFTGDAAGVLVDGAGQVVGAVADGVGEVIDDIGSAAEDAWDEVSSWF